MPQTIYGGQVGTATIRAGDAVAITIDAGAGAIVEVRRGDTNVSKVTVIASTTLGPYPDDMQLRVSAFTGATATISDPIDQNASRPTDAKVASFDSLVSEERITTWANRAALVTAGILNAFFTDVGVGGSFWFYSGGRWRPSAGRVVLKNLTSSVTHNSATRTVMDYATLPAGLWQDGDIIDMEWCKTLTGTDTDTTETALSAVAATFGDAMNLTTAALTNTNPIVSARWRWRRLGATSVRPISISGSVGLGTAGSIPADPVITTNLDTTDAYLQISGKLTTGSGPVTALRAHAVTLICGA